MNDIERSTTAPVAAVTARQRRLTTPVPFIDLAAQHRALERPIREAFARVLEGSEFVLGEEVEAFEREFASFLGARHAIGVASGLDAITLSLWALDVGRGDEVILPANSFISTALAVSAAGAKPVLVDVDPVRYGEPRHAKTKTLDADRDRTDSIILDHAMAAHKPVLAICYGCQILNVHQGGTLLQDIPAQKPGSDAHGKTDLAEGASAKDLEHEATLVPGSQLQKLAGGTDVTINSSHHQSIDRPGEKLAVTARGSDGIIEGVELQSADDWVVGVQWHPERMPDDAFARRLFAEFVSAARKLRLQTAGQR